MEKIDYDIKTMACQCGAENRAKLDALRDLAVDRQQISDDPKWSVTRMFDTLIQSYRLNLEWLAFDQWGGMVWKTYENDPEPFSMRIEFDIIEDGLVLALDYCFQKWGRWRAYEEEED